MDDSAQLSEVTFPKSVMMIGTPDADIDEVVAASENAPDILDDFDVGVSEPVRLVSDDSQPWLPSEGMVIWHLPQRLCIDDVRVRTRVSAAGAGGPTGERSEARPQNRRRDADGQEPAAAGQETARSGAAQQRLEAACAAPR